MEVALLVLLGALAVAVVVRLALAQGERPRPTYHANRKAIRATLTRTTPAVGTPVPASAEKVLRHRAPSVKTLCAITADELPIPQSSDKSRFFRGELASGEAVYFALNDEGSWIDVYARSRRQGERDGRFTGKYQRYGFSVFGNRWSYGQGPPAAGEIRTLMAQLSPFRNEE